MADLQWTSAPYRKNKFDCFADTPSGRYMIRKYGREFWLMLNNRHIATRKGLEEIKYAAEVAARDA